MPNKINNPELEHWLWEVEFGLEDERKAAIRIGKAFYHLRGEKYKKVGHLWRQDRPPGFVRNFADYCKWKWNMSESQVSRYILAYEVHRDLTEEEHLPKGKSSIPESERVLRPLTRLKNKEDRQRAFELAKKFKEPGEQVTAKDTAQAVEIVKGVANTQTELAVQQMKANTFTAKSERELAEFDQYGITTKDAYTRIDANFRRLAFGESERATRRLAAIYIEYLNTRYPNLELD
jgi:hypothetical protein